MTEHFVNRYQTTLAAGVSSGALTGIVTSTTGRPAAPFRAIIKAEGANTDEIVLVTLVAGESLTWTRAAEAIAGVQAASAHGIGATFTAIVTAAGLADLVGTGVAISALPAVTVPAGTDEFIVNQGGTSKKETLAQVAAFGGVNLWVGPCDPRGVQAQTANPIPDATFLQAFVVQATVTVSTIACWIGSITGGNICMGVYEGTDSALVRVATTGTVAAGTANTLQVVALTAPVALVPGVKYWAALAGSDGACTFMSAVGPGYLSTGLPPGLGMVKTATGLPIPATIDSPIAVWSLFFWCTLT